MAKCLNCEGYVSDRYCRVFAPEDLEGEGVVRACPNCTAVRDGEDIRQARARQPGQVGEIQ
ncbi:MAG: hypothetical protein RI560_08015 [Natronomonas sp.]|nr:hypothetical protein [Natronomonas sp.]